jgi:hypothetical protein
MIPSTYASFIDEVIYLTNSNKMKWSKTIEDDMFIYKSEDVTLTVSYYIDIDAETSYYAFIYTSPRNNIKDGFRVSNFEYDYPKMEELFGAASRSAQGIDRKLTNLLTQIKTETTLSKIKEGEARTAILTNNQRINVGWIRIEGENVVYYTSKGLREIFKPNMTDEEKKKSEELKNLSEAELIKGDYIHKIKISEIKDVI